MIKTIKIQLLPNNKQRTRLFQYAGTARFTYNWAISREKENFEAGNKFISDNDLRKEFTQIKKQEGFEWLNAISNNVPKQAIKDAVGAYKKFFKGQCSYPRFKSKRKSKPSFYQDPIKISFTETHVKLEGLSSSKKISKQKLNWVRLAEKNRIPLGVKYYNPRIAFDGLNWWISVGIDYEEIYLEPLLDGIGIDLGIKDLAICSDQTVYKNINKEKTIRKLKKKQRRLQRKVSKKYLINKKGESYCKTRNILKLEKELLKWNKRLTNIRQNYLHQTTTEIINRKPKFIVLEDLNVVGMMKNKHLSKAIAEQKWAEFRSQIEYKALYQNTPVIIAHRFYPSSKTCSECGCIHKGLKLKDRVFKCPDCAAVLDRDYNASLNLERYGERALAS